MNICFLFHEYYLSSSKQEIIKNIFIEKKYNVEGIMNLDYSQNIKIDYALKLQTLKTILQKLDIQNTYTSNQIIQRKTIEDMMNYLQENKSSIHMFINFS